jgi:hypothetical protein
MVGSLPAESLGSGRAAWTKLGIVGLPLACLSVLINISARQLLAASGAGTISLLGTPTVEIGAPMVPFGSTGYDLGAWVAAWLEGLFQAGVLTGYYLSWVCVGVGSIFTVIAFVMGKDPRRLLGGFMLVAHDRRVHVYLLFQLLFWIVSFNPWLVDLAVEVGTILVAAGSVFLISGTALLAISNRCGPIATILVVHPLGALTLVLPPIAAALVSPSFREGAREITMALTVWLLLNVLQPISLSRPLQRLFELEGAGFLLLWASLIVIIGWGVGMARHVRENQPSTDPEGRRQPLR